MIPSERQRLANFATLVLLAAEFMLVAGIIGSIIVLRSGAHGWADIETRLHFLAFLRPQFAGLICLGLASLIWSRAKSGMGVVLTVFAVLVAFFLLTEQREWVQLHRAGIGLQHPEPLTLAYLSLSGLLAIHLVTALAVAIGAVLLQHGTLTPTFRRNLGLYIHFGVGLALLIVILHLLLLL